MSEPQKPARRHHVVSRFYLRGFADTRKLIMRRPLNGKAHLQSLNDATVHTDFYTVRAEGVEQDYVEKQLSQAETEAAKAFNTILDFKTWPPTPEDRLAVSVWIGLQYLRGENRRRMVEELHHVYLESEVGAATVNQLRDLIGIPATFTDEQVEEIRAYMLTTTDARQIEHHMHLGTMGRILERAVPSVFHRRPWVLVDFSWDALGTSDTPVALVPDPDAAAGLRGVSIGTASELYVPLSARAALYMGGLGASAQDGREVGSAELAGLFNQLMLTTARRVLYYHPDSDPFAGLPMPDIREQELDASVASDLLEGWKHG
jgi:hypothetical protein